MLLELSPEERKEYMEENYNPLGYNSIYYEAYMEEKTYRNLKEFDHLNDITKHCLEYRDFLLRFLRKYEESEIGDGLCRNTDYSKNSIIHAGNSHSEVYVKFIKKWYDIEPIIRISQSYEFQHVSFDTPFDFFA